MAAAVGRVWSSEIQEAEDAGDDGFEADLSTPGKAGWRAWMFKCFEINTGGRSSGRKTTAEKALGFAFIFFIPIHFTIPLSGTGRVCLPEVKKHVAECNPRTKKKGKKKKPHHQDSRRV